jgi:hypothetical protein
LVQSKAGYKQVAAVKRSNFVTLRKQMSLWCRLDRRRPREGSQIGHAKQALNRCKGEAPAGDAFTPMYLPT